MKYRALGSTGLMVSEIGMGCEGFSENEYGMAEKLFDAAEALGINYFDLYASDPDLRAAVGRALRGRRAQFDIRPAVACVLAGAHSVEQLRTSAAYEDAPEAERDYAAALASFQKISWEGHCMYCSHCAPCPARIDVADVTKFLNLTVAQGGVPETVREHYRALEHHAGECVQRGVCETRCPFSVPIRENMRKAREVFGF